MSQTSHRGTRSYVFNGPSQRAPARPPIRDASLSRSHCASVFQANRRARCLTQSPPYYSHPSSQLKAELQRGACLVTGWAPQGRDGALLVRFPPQEGTCPRSRDPRELQLSSGLCENLQAMGAEASRPQSGPKSEARGPSATLTCTPCVPAPTQGRQTRKAAPALPPCSRSQERSVHSFTRRPLIEKSLCPQYWC